jgi:hypothetical protein
MQAQVQHQIVEDFHRLLQLPSGCGHRGRENFLHAWRALPGVEPDGAGDDPQFRLCFTAVDVCLIIGCAIQIKRIMRPTDVPDTGLLCDLLWSDPDKDIIGWGENDRGVSFTFGEDIVAQFLRRHDLDLICRAHQVVEDGYEFFARRQLVTLFSAPNYCGEFDNAGAMMSVDETLMCSFQVLTCSFLRT